MIVLIPIVLYASWRVARYVIRLRSPLAGHELPAVSEGHE